jgi:GNAT superfamily N-acetyltransferase
MRGMQGTSTLPTGYAQVPAGKIASVVTCLEMVRRPPQKPLRPLERPLVLVPWPDPDLTEYRSLFRRIGEQWLWFSRLVMPDEELAAILRDPRVEVFVLQDRGRAIGLLELDFREEGACELAFFGVVAEEIGRGAGRYLMDQAIARAWARPIRRFWVHTCTFDHPSAVGFYRRSGFSPYAFMVEIADDPRLAGHLPRDAGPHVPLIEG